MNIPDWLPLALLLCCLIPFVILAVVAVFVFRNASRIFTPDAAQLKVTYDRLKAKNPRLTTDQLVQKIINRQSFRSGLIGAITSVGGLPTLPLGLTIDLLTTARLQSETISLIGRAYEGDQGEPSDILNLNEVLALGALPIRISGRDLLVQGAQRLSRSVLRRTLVIVAEKSAAKLIPFVGFFIGFIVNYLSTQGISRVAAGWYSRRLVEPALMQPVRAALEGVNARR